MDNEKFLPYINLEQIMKLDLLLTNIKSAKIPFNVKLWVPKAMWHMVYEYA